jgi:hypothetical protein
VGPNIEIQNENNRSSDASRWHSQGGSSRSETLDIAPSSSTIIALKTLAKHIAARLVERAFCVVLNRDPRIDVRCIEIVGLGSERKMASAGSPMRRNICPRCATLVRSKISDASVCDQKKRIVEKGLTPTVQIVNLGFRDRLDVASSSSSAEI